MCVGTFEAGRTLYYVCTSVLYKNIYKVSLYGIYVHMTYLMCIRLDEGPSLLWSYGSCIYNYLWN